MSADEYCTEKYRQLPYSTNMETVAVEWHYRRGIWGSDDLISRGKEIESQIVKEVVVL